jgi:UDP-N-acetylglucosamine acyltransferase
MNLHTTAVVSPRATIHPTAVVGPFCVVGPDVVIGAHTQLIAHVVVQNRTRLGEHNRVHPFATLGGAPQDLKYNGEDAELIVGDHNVVRENVTLNIGTAGGRMRTRIGNHCLLMAYSHVAHDCRLGDHVVLANSVGLAGHVDIDDHAIVGGLAAVHQHCRIGTLAFVGGGSMVAQDVPPFCTAQGDRATLAGLNVVGLRRAGWDHSRVRVLRKALGALYETTHARQRALTELEHTVAMESDDVALLCAFVRSATRGTCGMRTPTSELTLASPVAQKTLRADAC